MMRSAINFVSDAFGLVARLVFTLAIIFVCLAAAYALFLVHPVIGVLGGLFVVLPVMFWAVSVIGTPV
jgi:hypothetical protein